MPRGHRKKPQQRGERKKPAAWGQGLPHGRARKHAMWRLQPACQMGKKGWPGAPKRAVRPTGMKQRTENFGFLSLRRDLLGLEKEVKAKDGPV